MCPFVDLKQNDAKGKTVTIGSVWQVGYCCDWFGSTECLYANESTLVGVCFYSGMAQTVSLGNSRAVSRVGGESNVMRR